MSSRRRRALVAVAVVAIVNLGDQESDLEGGYADQSFMLPNAFSLIAGS